MPGYIKGVIEKKRFDYEDLDSVNRPVDDQWEFVSKVHPFTGSQGDFKYMAFGMKKFSYFEPFPHKKGLPEGVTSDSKELILPSYKSERELDKAFNRYMNNEDGSTVSRTRYTKVSMLDNFSWNKGLSDENLEKLRNSIKEEDYIHEDKLQTFKLIDSTGKEYSERRNNGKWYYNSDISQEEAKKLALGDKIELEGQNLHLERRTRKEILPDRWFELFDLLKSLKEINDEVRLIFYWHH